MLLLQSVGKCNTSAWWYPEEYTIDITFQKVQSTVIELKLVGERAVQHKGRQT
jgi:hypothetical protein